MSSVQSTDSSGSSAARTEARPLRAAVVIAGKPGSYAMFEVRTLRADGATLAGALLPELDETLTLRIGDDDVPLDVVVRVVALDRGAAPGVEVRFVGVSAADRQRLEARARQQG